MQEFKFHQNMFKETGYLFPIEIVNDISVLFHGTSSINEKSIDKNGIKYCQPFDISTWSTFVKNEIDHLSRFKIDKFNKDQYPFFSLRVRRIFDILVPRDFRLNNGSKPVFLALSDKAAAIYATKQMAGGETLAGFRELEKDLQSIINNYDAIEQQNFQHYLKVKKEYLDFRTPENDIQPYEKLNLEKLFRFRADCKEVFSIATAAEAAHEYGVVYGIKLDIEDKNRLQKDNDHFSIPDIPLNNIIYKIKVPIDLDLFDAGPNQYNHVKRNYWLNKTNSSVNIVNK